MAANYPAATPQDALIISRLLKNVDEDAKEGKNRRNRSLQVESEDFEDVFDAALAT